MKMGEKAHEGKINQSVASLFIADYDAKLFNFLLRPFSAHPKYQLVSSLRTISSYRNA